MFVQRRRWRVPITVYSGGGEKTREQLRKLKIRLVESSGDNGRKSFRDEAS